MKAYKFETVVLEGGIIKIPQLNSLSGNEVEIFVIEKDKKSSINNQPYKNFEEFSNKWKGLLKDADINNWKEDYIRDREEKHK
jgi:hypothetical protein